MVSSQRRNDILLNIGQAANEASLSMKTFYNYNRIRLFCKSGQIVSGQSHLTYFYQNKIYLGGHLWEIGLRKLDKVYIQISDFLPSQYKLGLFSNLSTIKNRCEFGTIRNALKQLQKIF
jgi:hypothetical protein